MIDVEFCYFCQQHKDINDFCDEFGACGDCCECEPCPICGEFDGCTCTSPVPNAVPVTVYIPGEVYDNLLTVASDNGQSVEDTIRATLDKMFAQTPVVIPLDVSALQFIYYKSGKSVADVLPGAAKSARIEVLL